MKERKRLMSGNPDMEVAFRAPIRPRQFEATKAEVRKGKKKKMNVVVDRNKQAFNIAESTLHRDSPTTMHLVDVLDDTPLGKATRYIIIARDLSKSIRGNAYVTWRLVVDNGEGYLDNGHYGMTLDDAVQDAYKRLLT